MSLSTRKEVSIAVLCLVSVGYLLSGSRAVYAGTLSDLSDLPKIERLTTSNFGPDSDITRVVQREMALIRKSLLKVPVTKRPQVLHDLAEQTKWGTIERATAFLVCAWYDVDYERCRDYLLHTFFWRPEWGDVQPDSWAEDTLDKLYVLYERNHDFRLLHDMVTRMSGKGATDGCGGEALDIIKVDSVGRHPRGVLHVAAMSKYGRRIALDALTGDLKGCEVEKETFDKAHSVFPVYVRRVAADKQDLLAATARSLLSEATKLRKHCLSRH